MNQKLLVGGLVILLVLAVYVLSLVVTQDGDADPESSDGLSSIDRALRGLPFFGNELEADEVTAACFSEGEFVLSDADTSCSVEVAEDIDEVKLGVVDGSCTVKLTDQPNVFDSSFSTGDWTDGRSELSLTGDGATLVFDGGPCRVALNPEAHQTEPATE